MYRRASLRDCDLSLKPNDPKTRPGRHHFAGMLGPWQ